MNHFIVKVDISPPESENREWHVIQEFKSEDNTAYDNAFEFAGVLHAAGINDENIKIEQGHELTYADVKNTTIG